jgi:Arf-GAP with GTPase, ANK repeat and PH domain-containing protein 1/3/4/5/6/9/11
VIKYVLSLIQSKCFIFTGLRSKDGKTQSFTDKVLLTAFEVLKEPGRTVLGVGSNHIQDDLSSSSSIIAPPNGDGTNAKTETPHVKKRHRRMKSSGLKKDGDGDGKAFYIFFM